MIRRLAEGEIELFRAIRAEALRTDPDAFGETLQKFEARPESDSAAWFAQYVLTPRAGILVDQLDGHVRGMCGYGVHRDNPEEGYIWGMFVSPTARRLGIGAAMLEEATASLASAGLKRIAARVAAPNDEAIRFYEAVGFAVGAEPIGTLREGSDIPVHRIELHV